MKIYAARQQSDEAILDSLIGTETWIKVYYRALDMDYYIRILGKTKPAPYKPHGKVIPAFKGAECSLYKCNMQPASSVDYAAIRYTEEGAHKQVAVYSRAGFEHNLTQVHTIPSLSIVVDRPLSTYTTEEFMDTFYNDTLQ